PPMFQCPPRSTRPGPSPSPGSKGLDRMPKLPPGKPPSQRRRPEPPDDDLPPPRDELQGRFSDPDFRETFKRADLGIGVKLRDPKKSSIFYGMATLERVMRTGRAKEGLILKVPVDYETADVEYLIAACLTLKGSCCYNSGDGEPEMMDPAIN